MVGDNLPQTHPTYGGRLTYLKDLEVGTTFYVENGNWGGEIIEVDGVKMCKIPDIRTFVIPDNYYVWIR